MVRIEDLETALASADCVVIATDHDAYDWPMVKARAQLVIDTRHVLAEKA
jgi:UDP-N-acetyl-D-glucosamine dehydrogenase